MSDETDKDPVEDVSVRVMEQIDERFKKEANEREAHALALETKIEEMEKRLAANAAVMRNDQPEEPVSFGKIITAIRGMHNGHRNAWETAGAEREREIIETHAGQRTAMAAGKDSLGGFWVPEQYMPQEFIELFYGALILDKLGARMMGGLTGSPVVFPKQTGGATGYWVAENTAITESNLTAGQVNMEPKQLAALVKMSNRLDLLSNPAAEGLIRQDIANTLSEKLEKAALSNDTDAGAPDGLKTAPDIGSTSTASINVTNGNAMIYEVEADNALRGSLGWAMNPRTWSTMTGRYRTKSNEFNNGVNTRGPESPFPQDYLGYPVAKSTNVKMTASSTADVFFGNWAELLIGMWGGLSFAVSTEADTAFASNQIWIRAIMEVDFAVRHGQSFCYNESVTD